MIPLDSDQKRLLSGMANEAIKRGPATRDVARCARRRGGVGSADDARRRPRHPRPPARSPDPDRRRSGPKSRPPLPILAPDNFYSDFDELYPSGGGSEKEYTLGVRRAPTAAGRTRASRPTSARKKGGKPFGRGKVTLAKGRHGRFQPLRLRRSCSPPSIVLEGARRDLHDPGQGRRQADRPSAAGEDGQLGDQEGTALRPDSSLARRQHGAEQTREAPVDLVAPQRDQAVRALGARAREAGLAQHLEVMRAGRLRDADLARAAASTRQRTSSSRDVATRTGSLSAAIIAGERVAPRDRARQSACSTTIVLFTGPSRAPRARPHPGGGPARGEPCA